MKMKTILNVTTTQPQNSPAGIMMARLCYCGVISVLHYNTERNSSLHVDGENTLQLHLPLEDIRAFLDLVKECYGDLTTEVEAFTQGLLKSLHTA
jgi:hypothetical protein